MFDGFKSHRYDFLKHLCKHGMDHSRLALVTSGLYAAVVMSLRLIEETHVTSDGVVSDLLRRADDLYDEARRTEDPVELLALRASAETLIDSALRSRTPTSTLSLEEMAGYDVHRRRRRLLQGLQNAREQLRSRTTP